MLKPSSLAKWGVAVLLISSLSSCEDILEQYFPKPTPTPPTIPTFPPLGQDIAFYALSGGNRLDAYNTANAATRISSVSITGLGSGETLLAIDFRPATGQLYGVSSASRLYVINQNTGTARAIGAGAFTPALGGNLVGFDFNPTVDRIRLVTSTGQNLRLNPETGMVAATDGVLNGAAGATITGVAYTNNVAGAETTVLYDLDPATDQLFRQDLPNEGTLVAVGNLNLNISGDGGFDIDAKSGAALGLYPVNGNPTLFAVDLTTGAARPLAQYAANAGYTGIAIPTRPVAYVVNSAFLGRAGWSNGLTIFDLSNGSASITTRKSINLPTDEAIKGLDFRPATDQLYALTEVQTGQAGRGRLYTINAASGVATFVAELSIPLEGGSIGFDFNPVVDRIRIVTGTGQNLRVNPTDGVVIEDSRINPSTAGLGAAAYDNNFAGTTTTNLYVIDQRTDKLYLQNPPNAGTLVEIGNLGIGDIIQSDFDIGGTSNTAYALLRTDTIKLYTVNKSTGVATAISDPISPGTSFLHNGLAVGLGF